MSFCLNCLNEYHEASWSDLYAGDSLCPSCYGKFKPRLEGFSFLGHRAYVLYEYSDFFKTALYRFKGCSDIAMAPVFLCKSALFLRLFFRGYTLVPAPSHEEDNAERGFNHVEEIFKRLHLPMAKVLRKTERVKQAGSVLEARKEVGKRLAIKGGDALRDKKILFVDDVFTTGSTAAACARLILSQKPKSLSFFFLSKVSKRGSDHRAFFGSKEPQLPSCAHDGII